MGRSILDQVPLGEARQQAALIMVQAILTEKQITVSEGRFPIAVFLQMRFDEERKSIPSSRVVGEGSEHYTSSWLTEDFVQETKSLLYSVHDTTQRGMVVLDFANSIHRVLQTSRGGDSRVAALEDTIMWLGGEGIRSFYFTRERGRIGRGAEAMDLAICMLGMVQDVRVKKDLLGKLSQKISGQDDLIDSLRVISGRSLTDAGKENLRQFAELIQSVYPDKQGAVAQCFAERDSFASRVQSSGSVGHFMG